MANKTLANVVRQVKACNLCAADLTHGVRPVLQMHSSARILIAGQAPGAKVHASGVPFDDASGDRLRDWMGVDRDTFYNDKKIAILPMGFCYPGKGKSGDLPPRPICATTWRSQLLHELSDLKLTLVIGQYAQKWHLPGRHTTLTETVKNWKNTDDSLVPLPHPSPRNNIWMAKNKWFETQLLPVLKDRVSKALA